jgi:hypothetical protein
VSSEEKKKRSPQNYLDEGSIFTSNPQRRMPFFMQDHGIPRDLGIAKDFAKTKKRRKSNYQTARDFLYELAMFNQKYKGFTDVKKQKKRDEVKDVVRKILRGE